ncbi:calcium-binding protein [Streptomyces sp. NBC_00388]|uniref:calcium-binding protein n=1 Tax=Streptomyces sp. NBC_00388 TaxID=2975735 RepID=UPI002E1D2908
MRIRATVAAVTGALALSALVVPAAAQADGTHGVGPTAIPRSVFQHTAPSGAKVRAALVAGDPKISSVTVNSGKDIVLGTTVAKTITASVTATHSTGIQDAVIYLWHGSNIDTDVDGYLGPDVDDDSTQIAKCTAVNATTSTCKVSFKVDPRSQYDLYKNSLAGTWKVAAAVLAKDGSSTENTAYKSQHVQRASTQTVNAAPEPVKKGKTITVTGKLARANWETYKYAGYTGQPVKLQFRKKNSNTYTTVKTLKTNGTGNLSTTVKAVEDGYWRFNFAGTTTTPAAIAAGDFVDVK